MFHVKHWYNGCPVSATGPSIWTASPYFIAAIASDIKSCLETRS